MYKKLIAAVLTLAMVLCTWAPAFADTVPESETQAGTEESVSETETEASVTEENAETGSAGSEEVSGEDTELTEGNTESAEGVCGRRYEVRRRRHAEGNRQRKDCSPESGKIQKRSCFLHAEDQPEDGKGMVQKSGTDLHRCRKEIRSGSEDSHGPSPAGKRIQFQSHQPIWV